MTLLKSGLIINALVFSSALALAQVQGSIGRPGEGGRNPPGTIERPSDHDRLPPGDRYPDDRLPPGDRYPDERYPGDRYPGEDRDPGRGRQTIHCTSSGYRYNACPVSGGIVRVNLLRQHSRSTCNEGYSWGFNRDVIWVNHGCEAEFDVITGGGGGDGRLRPRPPRPPRASEQIINCESDGYNINQCFVGGYGEIIDVQLLRQISRRACDYGYSWGFDRDSVWVKDGCRATFRVVKDSGRRGGR